MNCVLLDQLLMDGSPEAMERAERHAESCASCRAALDDWNEISTVASGMTVRWENELLLPRIRKIIAANRRPGLMQVAAALLLSVGLGATAFYAVRAQTHDAAFDASILRVSALDEVENAEEAHMAAIVRLERLAEEKLDEPKTALMISYKEKLMLLDDAIAECEANIQRNRQNAHLRAQLLSMYSEKQQTLREVLREETNVETR